ncbi:MAG: hypothetical protein Q4C53_08290 [Clostridia bacterium]|nr:hypothetical protein [Clostridia bacterium]
MKKLWIAMLLVFGLALGSASAESAFSVMPAPEPDPASDFGIDLNVNMETIDGYLGLEDCVYRDMRLPVDPYDYAAIGGNSLLTGMIEGFTLVPYPYLAPCLGMPEVLGKGYDGPTLFSVDENGNYIPNYAESSALLEQVFPKDKAIVLMCGAGGYAGMTKNLLVSLGWNEGMIFNAGGFWFYGGDRAVELLTEEEQQSGVLHFEGLDTIAFDFARLTPVG